MYQSNESVKSRSFLSATAILVLKSIRNIIMIYIYVFICMCIYIYMHHNT